MANVREQRAVRGGINKPPSPWFIAAGSLVIVAFFGFPYALMFISSLKTRLEITNIPPDYFPSTPRWDNYLTVWASEVDPASSLLATAVVHATSTGQLAEWMQGAAGRLSREEQMLLRHPWTPAPTVPSSFEPAPEHVLATAPG